MPKYELVNSISWLSSNRSFIYFFDDLQLQIIKAFSPKASVENSLAQWAIFLILEYSIWCDSNNIFYLAIWQAYTALGVDPIQCCT